MLYLYVHVAVMLHVCVPLKFLKVRSFVVLIQVVGAKVVTNARSPGSRCYGFVTMSSADEATKCIQHLHRTELHGKMISVERVSYTSNVDSHTFYDI